MIDPHAKVPSAEQQNWIEFAELMHANLLRHALQPKLTPEECSCLLILATNVRAFHMCSLNFDAESEASRAKFAAEVTKAEGGCSH